MPCNCKIHDAPDGLPGTGKTPFSQCPKCAKKHIILAWAAWNEHTHERDNRDYVSANLRLAGEHLAKISPKLALLCHDTAIRIEDFEDWYNGHSIKDDIEKCRAEAWGLKGIQPPWETVKEEPIENLPEIPLVIPFRLDESYEGKGDELKILLRSVEKNVSGISKVVLVTDTVPDWLNLTAENLMVVPIGNPYRHCKDANLFFKMQKALEALNLTEGRWCFSADDSAFLQHCDLRHIPVIFNGSSRAKFESDKDRNKWHRRMANTFSWLEKNGVGMAYSYDCHLPQVFEVSTITEKINQVPWNEGEGFCIYTLWRGLEGICEGGISQGQMTSHFSGTENIDERPLDQMFVNYSDDPFGAGLRERLFGIFPNKSRFEL